MSRTTRHVLAGVVLAAGATAWLLSGGQVSMCLGPIGVTAIQCARATGIVPVIGLGLPLFALGVACAVWIVVPIPRSRLRPAVLAGGVGAAASAVAFVAAASAVAFVAVWPRTWEGLDSGGATISIERPLDPYALALAVILAAAVSGLGWGHLVAPVISRIRVPRS